MSASSSPSQRTENEERLKQLFLTYTADIKWDKDPGYVILKLYLVETEPQMSISVL